MVQGSAPEPAVKSNGPSAETFLLSSASAQAGVHPVGGHWLLAS